MPIEQFGDTIFNAIKDIEGVDLRSLEEARALGNNLGAEYYPWVRMDGSIDPNFFSHHGPGGGFSVLPHECASMFMGGSSQAATSVWATVKSYPNGGATWSKGFGIDQTSGRIFVSGVTRETVLLITMSGYFKASSVDTEPHGIAYLTDDASFRSNLVAPLSSNVPKYVELTHIRSIPSGNTWYEMQIDCSSVIEAADASSFNAGLFTVTRLR